MCDDMLQHYGQLSFSKQRQPNWLSAILMRTIAFKKKKHSIAVKTDDTR